MRGLATGYFRSVPVVPPEEAATPSDTEPPPAPSAPLWRPLVVSAVAVGSLAGLAEVCWSYKLPDWEENWRAVLPTSADGLLRFAATAVVTDVLVFVVAALLLGAVMAVARRMRASDAPPKDRWGLIQCLLWGIAWSYLYVGWQMLFMLPSSESHSLGYLATIGIGVVGAFVLAYVVSRLLLLVRRRIHQVAPVVLWAAAMAVILLATLPAFGRYRSSRDVQLDVPISAGGPRPNVLLVTVDTLRFDYLGCYGNTWIKTPAFDALAADGLLFDYAISQAPTTTPSHCSIVTSVYPSQHDAYNGKPMKTGFVTLADVLTANGYETVAFTASTTTRSINSGLQQGFDDYIDSLVPWSTVFSRDEFQNLIFFYLAGLAQQSAIRGDVVTSRALDWLDNRGDGPFFAWLHYFDPHAPYAAPEPYCDMYRGRLSDGKPMQAEREAYAGEVTYTDRQLGRVLDEFKKRSLYDNTLILVVADHGEAFGEKHWLNVDVGHNAHLYDTTQRVPLIIKPRRGRRHRAAVSSNRSS